jgi:hypothetical protein
MQRLAPSWQEVSATKRPFAATLPKWRLAQGKWDIDEQKSDIGKVEVGHRKR